MQINTLLSTMVDRAANNIGGVFFQQFYLPSCGTCEHDIDVDFSCANNLRFNGRLHKAQWSAHHKCNPIVIAFSFEHRAQTAQCSLCREMNIRIGSVHCLFEFQLNSSIFCACEGQLDCVSYTHTKLRRIVIRIVLIASDPAGSRPCITGIGFH